MKILITGAAGFIGFHLAKRLLSDGHEVLGIDNFNNYYDPTLKESRNSILETMSGYRCKRIDIIDKESLQVAFEDFSPEVVVNLAAQAGVRYSITNPDVYVQ